MRLRHLTVQRLFGRFNYEIPLREADGITLLTAPNGFGKTTILNLVYNLLSGRYAAALDVPFELFKLRFDDGTELSIQPSVGPRTDRARGTVRLRLPESKKPFEHTVRQHADRRSRLDLEARSIADSLAEMLPFLSKVGPRHWREEESGAVLSAFEVIETYGDFLGINRDEFRQEPREIIEFRESVPVLFIPADRLRSLSPDYEDATPRATVARETKRSVVEINRQLRAVMQTELGRYGNASHRIDAEFLARAIPLFERIAPISASDWESVYRLADEVRSLENRYQQIGLLEPAERSVIDASRQQDSLYPMYLRHFLDVKEKLQVLAMMARKLEFLQKVLTSAYAFKSVAMKPTNGLVVTTDEGIALNLDALSSGEQQLIVLFGRLLFREQAAIVLLDEPEISLHLAWQELFLSYLKEVNEIEQVDFLVATHSPFIINSNWDLTVELAEQVRRTPEDAPDHI